MVRLRPLLLAAALSLPFGALRAQDERDHLVRKDGKVLTGRLLTPHAAEELLLVQGGKRIRTSRSDLASSDLVADRVREFCGRRLALAGSPKGQWFLVGWAESHGLPGLARAQAMQIVLADDTNTEAHEFLGHKKGPRGWVWDFDGRTGTREQIEESLAKKPLELTGERFTVRIDAGLATNVAALLDLEQLAVVFHDRLGEALQLQESLTPMLVVCSRNGDQFPKWGFRPLPYYTPPPHGDVARTFYAGPNPVRPQRLFFVGAQALLYHTLVGEVARGDDKDRTCAWLELGLGMWFENLLQGPAGFAAPGPLRAQDLLALQALGRDFRLAQLTHLPMYGGFYLLDDTATAIHWSAATMFVAFLLDEQGPPGRRDRFLQFAREALGEHKGDSSTAFDKAMGQRIETLEEPFQQWLAKRAGK